jgi:hypothetical protein
MISQYLSNNQNADKPLPQFLRPEWITAYITALYALIAGLTLKAIKRQADTMDTQARDAQASTATAQQAANAATLAANTAKKALELLERADVFVSEVFTAPIFDGTSLVTVKVKNFGRSRADRLKVNLSLSIPRPPNASLPVVLAQHPNPFVIPAGDEVTSNSVQRTIFLRKWPSKSIAEPCNWPSESKFIILISLEPPTRRQEKGCSSRTATGGLYSRHSVIPSRLLKN